MLRPTCYFFFRLDVKRKGAEVRGGGSTFVSVYNGIEAFIESISGAVSQRALLRGTYRLRALNIFHCAPTHRADILPNICSLPFTSLFRSPARNYARAFRGRADEEEKDERKAGRKKGRKKGRKGRREIIPVWFRVREFRGGAARRGLACRGSHTGRCSTSVIEGTAQNDTCITLRAKDTWQAAGQSRMG